MCGIAGLINGGAFDLNIMTKALGHRGPDDFSIYKYNNVALMHTRLAIQDIDHGKQPMHHGNYSIIFNGEIYNHLTLRSYLKEFVFKTRSDTETLLYLYIKFKIKMFDLIDGMFSFAILDKNNNKIFIAKDRAGEKPLYYYQLNNQFMFSSELNAIKSIICLEVNEDAIFTTLRCGFLPGSISPYQSVMKLAAGSYLEVNLQSIKSTSYPYFKISEYYKKQKVTVSLDEAVDQVDSYLTESIKDRLESSDVEVGAFLSGGIDSNLIVAIASQFKPNLRTFTVKFSNSFDESYLANLTVDKYAANHSIVNIDTESRLVDDIDKILMNYGEPFVDSSAIPSYYVAEAAKKHVNVILCGDGADELFAGYRRYVPFANNSLKYIRKLSSIFACIPAGKKRSFFDFATRLRKFSSKNGLDLYLSATTDIFEDNYVFHKTSFLIELDRYIKAVFNDHSLSQLSKVMLLDFSLILSGDLLPKMDIATMAHALEGRNPFLSRKLLEYAPSLPDRYKIHGMKTKYILRVLAKKYLPNALLNQPKRGFEVPLVSWVDGILRDRIFDCLHGNAYIKKFVHQSFIDRLLNDKASLAAHVRVKMLWSLFCLEIWYQNDQKIYKGCTYL